MTTLREIYEQNQVLTKLLQSYMSEHPEAIHEVSGGLQIKEVQIINIVPRFSRHEDEFVQWFENKNLSRHYTKSMIGYLSKYLTFDLYSPRDLQKLPLSLTMYIPVAMRIYINFLEGHEYIDDLVATRFRRLLKSNKLSTPDAFVPSSDKVRETYQNIKRKDDRMLYQLLTSSGLRATEIIEMLKNFDKSKLIVNGNVAKYPLFLLRKSKKTYYCYLPLSVAKNVKKFSINKDTLSRRLKEYGINPKYLRKFFYSLCIENGVPESIADFYEGRAPVSIGSMHYLSTEKIADKEYSKVLPRLEEIFIPNHHNLI